MEDIPSLRTALKPHNVPQNASTGGAHSEGSGARKAATDGLARKFKPFVITPVTLPGLEKPRRRG